MTVKLAYQVREYAQRGETEYCLVRTGTVAEEKTIGFIPEVAVATFSSEEEARLFEAYLAQRERSHRQSQGEY